MSDLTSRPEASALVADVEASACPEPHVELAPVGERAKIWAAALLFCLVVWGALFRAVLG